MQGRKKRKVLQADGLLLGPVVWKRRRRKKDKKKFKGR